MRCAAVHETLSPFSDKNSCGFSSSAEYLRKKNHNVWQSISDNFLAVCGNDIATIGREMPVGSPKDKSPTNRSPMDKNLKDKTIKRQKSQRQKPQNICLTSSNQILFQKWLGNFLT